MNEVYEFITNFYKSDDIEEVFEGEFGYWFAMILYRRFITDGAKIMCNKEHTNFGTMIHGKVYDITGIVTEKCEWVPLVKI